VRLEVRIGKRATRNQEYKKNKTYKYEEAKKPRNRAIARGYTFIWRDIAPRERRREKKPKVRLKNAKEHKEGINNQNNRRRLSKDLSRQLLIILAKSNRLTSKSSIATANSSRETPKPQPTP
jgi:hypothetical protein